MTSRSSRKMAEALLAQKKLAKRRSTAQRYGKPAFTEMTNRPARNAVKRHYAPENTLQKSYSLDKSSARYANLEAAQQAKVQQTKANPGVTSSAGSVGRLAQMRTDNRKNTAASGALVTNTNPTSARKGQKYRARQVRGGTMHVYQDGTRVFVKRKKDLTRKLF